MVRIPDEDGYYALSPSGRYCKDTKIELVSRRRNSFFSRLGRFFLNVLVLLEIPLRNRLPQPLKSFEIWV